MKFLFFSLVLILFSLSVVFYGSWETNNSEFTAQVKSFFFGGAMAGLTDAEYSHMYDVRFIFIILNLVLVALLVFLYFSPPSLKEIKKGALVCLFMPILAILPFDKVFTWFHMIFFPQGNWEFNGGLLVSTFTFSFFELLFIKWVIICVALALALVSISQYCISHHTNL